MRIQLLSFVLCTALLPSTARAQATSNYLADNTVLIIRHAEKPAAGVGLTDQGEARALAYATYFEPFHENGLKLRVDALYSGADSNNSHRPRLTLEPLSKAAGLPLHTDVDTSHPEELVSELRSQPHGHTPLVAWRHGHIPALLKAFGASPDRLLPEGVWPDDVFDDVIVLTFDHAGRLVTQTLIREHLNLPTGK